MTQTPRPWRYKHHPGNRQPKRVLEAALERLRVSNACLNSNPGLCSDCRKKNVEVMALIVPLIEDTDA